MSEKKKITVATTWLDGCSGCHMSFLDIDMRLVELAEKIEVVYSPLVDSKELPKSVDVGILEGSISNEEDLAKALEFRKHCKFLISLGDCAVAGNVPAMRNVFQLDAVYDRAYQENVDISPDPPHRGCSEAAGNSPADPRRRRRRFVSSRAARPRPGRSGSS